MPEAERPVQPADLAERTATRIASIKQLLSSSEVIVSKPHQQEAKQTLKSLKGILCALDAGYEPTTPPATWFAGWYDKPKFAHGRGEREFQSHLSNWPAAGPLVSRTNDYYALVWSHFTSPVPAWAFKRYEKAGHLFGRGNIVVYSPEPNDFTAVVTPLPCEPVFIGLIVVGGVERYYFEIARWEIGRDLNVMYRRLVGGGAPGEAGG